MKKTLIVAVLLISIAGFAMADTSGFHSMPVDRFSGSLAFISEGQNATLGYDDGSADRVLNFGESGFSFASMQVWGDHEGGLLNFYLKEQFAYMIGASYKIDGTAVTITDAAGYFGAFTAGVSTNLPTFVEDLEIMVGAGYHIDMGYAAMTYGTNDLAALIDLSLAGIGFNVLADWMLLGDLGVTLGFDFSIDLWGITLPLSGLTADVLSVGPGINFDIAVGVSIPNDLAEELGMGGALE